MFAACIWVYRYWAINGRKPFLCHSSKNRCNMLYIVVVLTYRTASSVFFWNLCGMEIGSGIKLLPTGCTTYFHSPGLRTIPTIGVLPAVSPKGGIEGVSYRDFPDIYKFILCTDRPDHIHSSWQGTDRLCARLPAVGSDENHRTHESGVSRYIRREVTQRGRLFRVD